MERKNLKKEPEKEREGNEKKKIKRRNN